MTVDPSKKYHGPLSIIMSLFFMWGLLTVLNDILVPHLKSLFDLNYVEAMLIQFCFFAAYGIMSLPSGKLVEYFGYKRSVIIGLVVAGSGCLIFLPAAAIPSYAMFLLGLFVLATGIVLLQVAANPYVALLGKSETAASRMNLAQAFNSLGTTIGPQIGAVVILSLVTNSNKAVEGIEILYMCLAGILLLIALLIGLTKLPKIASEKYEEFRKNLSQLAAKKEGIAVSRHERLKLNKVFAYPHLVWGIIAIFCYVGAEVSIGSFLVNFLMQTDILGLSNVDAGQHVSYYWGGAMIGRFIGFAVLLKIRARTMLLFNSIIAILLTIVTLITSGGFSGYTILSIGLFNSIMFPTIFTLAIAGLDTFTPQGSGLLCTAIVGGAIMPIIQGYFADIIGIHHAFFIPLLCYLYIFFYAWKGSVAKCKVIPSEDI